MAKRKVAPVNYNVEIHQKSQITADVWVKKITDSDDVPPYFKRQITSEGRLILVPAKHFLVDDGYIEKTWLTDWLSAFVGNGWELTTGELRITITKGKVLEMTSHLVPDLGTGEDVGQVNEDAGLTVKRVGIENFEFEYGDTMPADATLTTTSRKKLIAIANRVTLRLADDVTTIPVADSDLVFTWFHELTCHAGRFNQSKPASDKDDDVKPIANDIKEMLSKRETTGKIHNKINPFLNLKTPPKK